MKSWTPCPHGIPAAIQHVLYIVKENRTYDQVLGDIGKGESDPSLCLFKENVSPNHHKLAREFVLFDNFYVNGDVSARRAQLVHVRHRERLCGEDVAQQLRQARPQTLRLRRWRAGRLSARRLSVDQRRGGAVFPCATTATGRRTRRSLARTAFRSTRCCDPVLAKVTNMKYRSFDLDYPDVKRAQIFLDDLAQFESTKQMPALMFMRLGNDHTVGTTPGKIAPLSSFADNDYALGMIVEGVSRSKFWGSTAIFVLEDDAQNGPDHVDSHRSRGLRHFALHAYRRHQQHHVQHHVHAAHHGADSASAPHDALRRRRAAHVERFSQAAGR